MNRIYKNLILSFAIILCVSIGVFAQKDDDKKPPKDDGPKIVVRPKPDEPKPSPTPKPEKPKKPSSTIIENVRKDELLTGIMKILIG